MDLIVRVLINSRPWASYWKIRLYGEMVCYGLFGCLAYTAGPLDSYRPIYSFEEQRTV